MFRTAAARSTLSSPRQESLRDPLTGLPNAHLLIALLELATKRPRSSPWLVVIRFDCLHSVRGSLGPRAEGELLSKLARRLKEIASTTGQLARSGDIEFTLLIDGEEADCVSLARHVASSLRDPITLESSDLRQPVLPAARIGLAGWQEGAENARGTLRRARLAATTPEAPSHVTPYSEGLRTDLLQGMRLEAELGLALDRKQLRLEYQPMISIESGEVTGLEALLRWDHPELGSVPPDEIIPVAEETGLIDRIGDWVLRESCRQMAAWQAQFPGAADLTLNVNISARQLEQPELVERILAAKQSSGLGAGTLRLELTETMLVANPEAAQRLVQLKRHGIEIQLDDFGSGYSSLSYLSRFPIDALKLDRSLLDGAEDDPKKAVILEAVVRLADALGLSITAEGIETPQQADRMRNLPCHTGQGFFFCRPLDGAAVEELLTDGQRTSDFFASARSKDSSIE